MGSSRYCILINKFSTLHHHHLITLGSTWIVSSCLHCLQIAASRSYHHLCRWDCRSIRMLLMVSLSKTSHSSNLILLMPCIISISWVRVWIHVRMISRIKWRLLLHWYWHTTLASKCLLLIINLLDLFFLFLCSLTTSSVISSSSLWSSLRRNILIKLWLSIDGRSYRWGIS